jgi:tetratricopeptide (TPR) repeat protein
MTGTERQQLAQLETTNSAAYQSYLKGRHFWNKRTNPDFKKAIEFFEEAREQDPEYALAQVGLADSYILLGGQFYGADEEISPADAIGKARIAAQEALRLDPSLAEALATMGFIKMYDWDWEGAERDFKQAIALNPSYVTAHQWYGLYLYAMGRHDEAVEQTKRALELEPISPLQNRELGRAFLFSGKYPEAVEQFEKTLELDPNFSRTREYLVDAYWLSGMQDEAIAEAEKIHIRVARFFQLLKSGKKDEANDLLDSLPDHERLLNVHRHMMTGDLDKMFAHLERAFRDRNPQLPFVVARPVLDPLRSDPRLTDLRTRMGLEP